MSYTVPAGRYGDTSTAFIQAYIDQAIAGVIDLAPETLNSLNELAAAINDDPAFYATVANQVDELNTDVTDLVTTIGIAENDVNMGDFTAVTLPDSVTLKAVLEAFASAYETTKSNLESADSIMSGRLDTLEADPTTAAAVQAVQADVDQNELDSDAADLALSNRLDILEADPTTQAYVDNAVSALVDLAPATLDTLNELAASIGDDADFIGTMNAANTALSDRLDTLEADPTTQTYVDSITGGLGGRLDTVEINVGNVSGGVTSTTYAFDQGTAAEPSSKDLRFNSTTPASVTEIYISKTNKAGVDLSNVIPEMLFAGVRIYIQNEGDASQYLAATITSVTEVNATYTLGVNEVTAGSLLSNNAKTAFAVIGKTPLDLGSFTGVTIADNATPKEALQSLETAVETSQTALTDGLALKFNKAGGSITGNFTVDKSFPDVELKANDEKRVLFSDAGGSSTAAIKHVSTTLDFFAGGIAAGNNELSVTPNGVVIPNIVNAANDTDAATAGVPINGIYHHNGALKVRVS
jgi:hypothetical protein